MADVQADLVAVRSGGVFHHVGTGLGEGDLQIGAGLVVHSERRQRATQEPAHGGNTVYLAGKAEPNRHAHAVSVPDRSES
ncbi:hypothetical protein GCM10023107_15140 [Actinoplanes octamycinicus]|nr:hypothetical protein Aoc01nite_19070 [Actinoplanes octamycinicus]